MLQQQQSQKPARNGAKSGAGSGSNLRMVSRGILLLIFPPLKTGRATFTASGFQKSRGCQVVNLLVAVEMKVF